MQSRISKDGREKVLIKWQDLPHHEDSWELADEVQTVFPQFDLEDKVHLEGEGIDRGGNRWGKVYVRKYPRKS